jgi:RNA polymerase sigma-70 factor, ECF subfamily
MIEGPGTNDQGGMEPELRHGLGDAPPAALSGNDLRQIHDIHAAFVWKTLSRCGVADDDLLDASQDAFVVVHRRLADREGTSSLTTWLYGICIRVAAAYRRRAFRRRERLVEAVPDAPTANAGPDDELAIHEARALLARLLEGLPIEQRVVFVMFEMDEIPCQQIADVTGVPLGTVYSRLRAARAAVADAASEAQRKERST